MALFAGFIIACIISAFGSFIGSLRTSNSWKWWSGFLTACAIILFWSKWL